MSEERLLIRIQNLESQPEARFERSVTLQINSIISHLQRMLNTRQGSVPIADDYGIPDITNSPGEGLTDMTRRIESTIQNVILKYEPRLTNVRVHFLAQKGDVLSMCFKLEGLLISDRSVPVVLETIVSSEGKFDVTE
ncbi:MAG TPA: type VI secretion system baseplate subunit TssE [archaeon]|nr:type VI secretion system baseplate subunit TssE [archaeon]